MIETIFIKNFAIINELEVNFHTGLNVLSGETGAGKSIIIGSINFVLGGKADRDIVKTGENMCEVSMVMSVSNPLMIDKLSEIGIDMEDDNSLLIKRTFNMQGKSNCKVNGRPATVTILRKIASLFVDIHSQHDNHKLLNAKNHISILDRVCGNDIIDLKSDLSNEIDIYNELGNKIKELDTTDIVNQDLIDLYKFQIDEINNANLQPNEDVELDNRRTILSNSAKLRNYCDNVINLLYRDDNAVVDAISDAISNLTSIQNIDDSVSNMIDELNSAYTIVEDVVGNIRNYVETIDYDSSELDDIEDRLSLVYNLKKKYGKSIESILSYMNNTSDRLNKLLNSEELVLKYKNEQLEVYNKIISICKKISNIRKTVAKELGGNIQNALYDLCMESATFDIKVTENEKFNSNGFNNVEFMISANKGEPLKPLNKVASGGEMSRVMLAMKSLLSDTDSVDAFIFDEIDTGISGRTAQRVAEKLKVIAGNHQILCITHLPQIAAMADTNYLIEKSSVNDNTQTNIIELEGEEVYKELARLIGGSSITETTLAAAKEMKEMSEKYEV